MFDAPRIEYGLLMLLAVGICGWLLGRSQRSLELSAFEKLAIGVGAFCGAMLGAKLPFVLADWEGLRSGTAWFSDGKTILTGLVGGYFGVEVTKWCLHVKTRTGDSFAAPVALAVAVGRLACFRVGCCHGKPTDLPWGVIFPAVDDQPRHPTQLYEFGFHLVAALSLQAARRWGFFPGQLMKLYLVAYGVYRFGSEWLRPEAVMAGSLTGYQWGSALVALAFGLLAWWDAAPSSPPIPLDSDRGRT